ncbi:MAG: winged helix-turn-helix transcriptional regulator [Clostridiales bacterium]|jgi:DNA-binding MarR family transcriptional regulator|nr:winged helix-turn-helix transcriptional regulator [Clostridiales bacterium]
MGMQLYMALYRTFHAQKNRIRPGMTQLGLSPGQPKVLSYLSQQEGCMQKEIALALDIEPATVSQILSNMEQGGLIRRSGALERRRAESVFIAEAGREVYEKWQELCRGVEDEALRGFSEDERERFVEYLTRMYKNLTGRELE